MINELYQLSEAMKKSQIQGEKWSASYHALPSVSDKAPCIQILLSGGKVSELNLLSRETAAGLRKYGNNQGTYPAMNLLSLYRVTDETIKKQILGFRSGKDVNYSVEEIKSWCKTKNWNQKFVTGKYRVSIEHKPAELKKLLPEDEENPIQTLISQTEKFSDAEVLFSQLEEKALEMLRNKNNIAAALHVLFYLGAEEKAPEKDTGSLSVIFDCEELAESGYPTIGETFTQCLNQALLEAENQSGTEDESRITDAFGNQFVPIEKPMPKVKLAGGFDAALRTMFHGQPCQKRYGRIENASYPIAQRVRLDLQSALEWIGDKSQEGITWNKLDKNEILFAYPSQLPEIPFSFVAAFGQPVCSNTELFEKESEKFLQCLHNARESGTDPASEFIRIFILKKMDKARTKVVYTYNTTPDEIESRSEAWSSGCRNLPQMSIGNGNTLFPMEAGRILNWHWKQDGTLISDKVHFFSSYHGLELMFGTKQLAQCDLSALVQNCESMAPSMFRIGKNTEEYQKSLMLMGLLLYWQGIRKEKYMEEFPYLYGQLLKVSDELHALYCKAARKDGSVPPQLVGGSLYNSAAEMPIQTLAQLGQRMNPYIVWAKSYQYKQIGEKGKESWKAGWYLNLYASLAEKLREQIGTKRRFNDQERAELFIGYLAAFPKKNMNSDNTEE